MEFKLDIKKSKLEHRLVLGSSVVCGCLAMAKPDENVDPADVEVIATACGAYIGSVDEV